MYTECPKTEALGEFNTWHFSGNGKSKDILKYIAIRNISLLRQCFGTPSKHVPVALLFVRVSFL